MRFADAREAGQALAAALEDYGGRADALVLAVARGGAGVGAEVAGRLGLPLDLLMLRRLLVPRGASEPACAFSLAGSPFLDELGPRPAERAFEHFLEGALAELRASERACRGERPPADLRGKTILLVDNGVRTGSTILAALRAVRSAAPARVVAAVPVAAREALAAVEGAADAFRCLASPEPFGHVGLWYEDFGRPGDEELRAMLEEAARHP